MRNHPVPQATRATRPFLKWAGGKSRVLSHIIPALPKGRRLIEPFVGGGAVFLNAIGFERYLLGDSNEHLINLYRAIVERPQEFIDVAQSFFNESFRSPERYLEVRHAFNRESDVLMQSAQFLFLNRFGFNGLCRYNRSGQYNVPYGHLRQVPSFPSQALFEFAEKGRHATFIHGDFADIMRSAKPGDVIYADPPYLDRDDAPSFRSYGVNGFGLERHRELADLARELAGRGVPVAISNHDCSVARDLYAGAEILTFSALCSVSAAVDSRGHVGELLAIFEGL